MNLYLHMLYFWCAECRQKVLQVMSFLFGLGIGRGFAMPMEDTNASC
jgi:hypothetical protein